MTIKGLCTALPMLLLGWLATLSIVAVATDAAPAYVVLFPSDAFLGSISGDVSVVSASNYSITLTSEQRGFAEALYRLGATLVLPAGLPGCAPTA